MANRDLDMARKIAEKVKDNGGKAYFVGGFVRDRLLGIDGKDIDIEVHGIPYEKLAAILDSMGNRMEIGASFGINGLKGYDLDIAMPRREKATGCGHKDFEVYIDPYIGTKKAARRRDFTVNALMQDILTGEVIDHFGGRTDLKNRVLRHVDIDSFAEDPLRVLRGAQFAARFGFTVADETLTLCRTMNLKTLSKERIFGELEKALLKAEKPSVFFSVLREMGQLSYWFAEVESLIDVPQDPEHHPEGDVWNHTMLVLDNAAELRVNAQNKMGFMLSALCHDFGKSITTEVIKGRIHAYEHETKGLGSVKEFVRRLTNENALLKYVSNMVELHMRPNMMVHNNSSEKAFMRMFDSAVAPEDLLLLSKADYLGSIGPEGYDEMEKVLQKKLSDYYHLMKKPSVQGADLIASGVKPGPEFKEALEYAHKLHLAGIDKEIALKQTLGIIKKEH